MTTDNAFFPTYAQLVNDGAYDDQPTGDDGRATAAQVSAIKIGVNGKPDISQLLAESKPKTLFERWKLRTLKDAYTERPPVQYVVGGLFALPSLNVVYGAPGSMKSMMLADAAVSVAAGLPWLEPLPTEEGQHVKPFSTMRAPVLWIDYDNGTLRTDERFDALARARGLPDDAPIHYVSMAQPWLDANDGYMVRELAEAIIQLGVKLVIIDNLGLISGDADENSADMVKVMGNLRRLAEDTGAAVVVIHHQRKGNMADRAGDLLRGHSSIEAALDLALLVTRENQDPKLIIRPTKVRGASIASAFGAEFTYTHKRGTKDLESARFWGFPIISQKDMENQEIAGAAMMVIERAKSQGEKLKQGDLVQRTADYMAANRDGKKPGRDRVRGVLDGMVTAGQLRTEKGRDNAVFYATA